MSFVFCLVRAVPIRGEETTCVFPFTVKNDVYYECVPLIPDNSSLVCATTDNFNRDLAWGICVPGELTSLHSQ